MANEPGYQKLLALADTFVAKIVPGQRMRIRSGRIERSQSELFALLPEGSIGNAIRFDPRGRMFVADYNIFPVGPGGKAIVRKQTMPITAQSGALCDPGFRFVPSGLCAYGLPPASTRRRHQ
jgi:hypothetical protein